MITEAEERYSFIFFVKCYFGHFLVIFSFKNVLTLAETKFFKPNTISMPYFLAFSLMIFNIFSRFTENAMNTARC